MIYIIKISKTLLLPIDHKLSDSTAAKDRTRNTMIRKNIKFKSLFMAY